MITSGLNAGNVPLAAAGAAVAGAIVLAAGALAHRPLANVPQNTLKFAVGLLLSTFGAYWAVEAWGCSARAARASAGPAAISH